MQISSCSTVNIFPRLVLDYQREMKVSSLGVLEYIRIQSRDAAVREEISMQEQRICANL